MVVLSKIQVLWDATLCHGLSGSWCLHCQVLNSSKKYFLHCFTLKMEALQSFEKSATVLGYNPEDLSFLTQGNVGSAVKSGTWLTPEVSSTEAVHLLDATVPPPSNPSSLGGPCEQVTLCFNSTFTIQCQLLLSSLHHHNHHHHHHHRPAYP